MSAPEKRTLRAAARARRMAMEIEAVAVASARITGQVLALPEWRAASVVWGYVSAGNEVDTRALLIEALDAGKLVCLPRTDGAVLHWHAVTALETLEPDRYGIHAPAADAAPAPPPAPGDVCLVPALGFRSDGHRLGRGGGHYNRFLADFPGAAVGLAYAWQIDDAIPVEAHDAPVALTVTEASVLRA